MQRLDEAVPPAAFPTFLRAGNMVVVPDWKELLALPVSRKHVNFQIPYL